MDVVVRFVWLFLALSALGCAHGSRAERARVARQMEYRDLDKLREVAFDVVVTVRQAPGKITRSEEKALIAGDCVYGFRQLARSSPGMGLVFRPIVEIRKGKVGWYPVVYAEVAGDTGEDNDHGREWVRWAIERTYVRIHERLEDQAVKVGRAAVSPARCAHPRTILTLED